MSAVDVRFPLKHSDFVEDAENLIGIDGAEREVVIGVAAIVEMEAADHFLMKKPGDDLLDILRLVVMARVDEHQSLRAGMFREEQRHSPVCDIRVIEGGFEGLVFDEQALAGF